jgi:16S rRNA (guanine1207-N2)-methyltransferase
MTQSLLDHIPTPAKGSTVLDFACGSGIIGAALLEKQPSIVLHMLDADSVATEAVRHNVRSACEVHLSDGWASVDPSLRFDFVFSNPPVHSGIADDLEVIRGLVQGAAPRCYGGGGRLKPGGMLCLVTQTQIPTGCILHAHGFAESQRKFVDCEGGHFLVWKASVGQPDAAHGEGTECNERTADLLQHQQRQFVQVTECQSSTVGDTEKTSRKRSTKLNRQSTGKHNDRDARVQAATGTRDGTDLQFQELLQRGDVAELTAAKLAAASVEDYDRAALLKRHIDALQGNGHASPTDNEALAKIARKRKRNERQKQRKKTTVQSAPD